MNRYSLFGAKLINESIIEVSIPKSYRNEKNNRFFLYDDETPIGELKVESVSEATRDFHYRVVNAYPLKLGRNYVIADENNIFISLDCSYLMRLDKYVDRMVSDEPLGAIYSKKGTTFRIFSPLASSGIVRIDGKVDQQHTTVILSKNEKTGILEGYAKGDFASCQYAFMLKINNEYRMAVDPYAKGISLLSKASVIVNPKDVEVDLHNDKLRPFASIADAIIYEVSIRDLISDPGTAIRNKGKYAGWLEEGVVTGKGNPVGIDYLKSLGITHVQLLPVFDFQTTNDLHPEDTYNWGYDPCNYNVPEGSFSLHPEDPLCRIVELKKVIAKLHENNIRVVMDVVYNHVFNMETSCFEQACPNYYFRFNPDGSCSNGTFCGNEFESRHLMGRKYLIDSCKYWISEYGVDGFRFDLMGILDIETMKQIVEECRRIKPDALFYGEGWDMPTVLPSSQKTSMNNAHLVPEIGFFNDRFRDIVKGKTGHDELAVRGYLSGDTNYIDGFKHVFSGSVLPIAHPPLFVSPTQSINYVECHDNHTLYDKLKACTGEDETTLLRRVRLVNAAVMFASGVPFFHMGQEIGLSKGGDPNSYRSGDAVNQFRYEVLDKRKDLWRFFKDAAVLRKKLPFLRMDSRETIEKTMEFSTEQGGVLKIRYKGEETIRPYRNVLIFVNPTIEPYECDLSDYYKIIFNESGLISSSLYSQHLIVNPLSLVVCVKE